MLVRFVLVCSLVVGGVLRVPQAAQVYFGSLGSGNSPISDNTHPRLGLVADGLSYPDVFTVAQVKARLGTGGDCAAGFATFLAYVNSVYASPPFDDYTAANFAFVALTYGVTGANYAGHSQADYAAVAKSVLMRLAQYGIVKHPPYTPTAVAGGTLTVGHDYWLSVAYQTTALQPAGAEGYGQILSPVGDGVAHVVIGANRTIRVPVVASADPQVDAIAIYVADVTDGEDYHLWGVVPNTTGTHDIPAETWAAGRLRNTIGWAYDKNWMQQQAADWLQALPGVLAAGDLTDMMTQMKLIDQADGTGTTAANVPINYWGNSFTNITRAQKTLSAVVMAGNGADDAWSTAVLNAFRAYWRNDTATTNYQNGATWTASSYAGADGGFAQGTDYGYLYTYLSNFMAEEGYRTGMGISRSAHYNVAEASFITNVIPFSNYEVIPDAFPRTFNPALPGNYYWLFAKTQKVFYPTIPAPQEQIEVRATLAAAQSATQGWDSATGALARWLMVNRTGTLAALSGDVYWKQYGLWHFLFDVDPLGTGTSPVGTDAISAESTRGEYVFRTDWTTSIDTPWVVFLAGQYYTGSSGLTSPGDFQIYRKGPVVLRQGLGVHGWVGHSMAGSILAFPDTSLTYLTLPATSNMGSDRGNFNPTNHFSTDMAVTSPIYMVGARRSRLATGGAGADVNYVFADLTRHYDFNLGGGDSFFDSAEGPRISSYVRQFVYFLPVDAVNDPLQVVIFDRATVLDTDFQMNWAMYTAGEPLLTDSGTWSAGPNRGPTGTAHKNTSNDMTFLSASNTLYGADSTLWITPLLPASRTVNRIESADAGAPNYFTFEDVYGRLYPDGQDSANHEANAAPWRLEVVPQTPALTNNFLIAIEVGDNGISRYAASLISGSGWTGARVRADRIAIFGADGFAKTTGTFTLPASFTGSVHVAGLSPSTPRTLTPDSNCNVNSLGAGVAYTAGTGTSGTFYVTVVVGGTPCVVTVS